MALYHYVGTLHNRIFVDFTGPDDVRREVSFNEVQLNQYQNENQLRSAIDLFTEVNYGYVLTDYWVHKNDDGSWAFAVGAEPAIWPEDDILVIP